MGQSANIRDGGAVYTFNQVVIWIMSTLGLIGNIFGFIPTYLIEIGFPATRLLIRLQYVWDTIRFIVVAIYWIMFHLDIPLAMLTNPVFSSLWSSYYVVVIFMILSSTNTVLLSIDRYWAIVWFRTYRRDSSCYRLTLITIMFVWMIVITMPTFILGYLDTDKHIIGAEGITVYRKAHSIILFFCCVIGPSILICATQVHILVILHRLNRGRATGLSSIYGTDRTKQKTIDENTRALSKSIIVMMVAFFVVRFPFFFGYVLSTFEVIRSFTIRGWRTEMVVSFSASFCVNPFVLIFTNKKLRKCVFGRLHSYVKMIRQWCSRCLPRRL